MLNLNNSVIQSASAAGPIRSSVVSLSRLQLLSRGSTLNVALAKQLQQQQQQSTGSATTAATAAAAAAAAAATGNLSPSILINDAVANSIILTSVNNAMAIRRPSVTNSQQQATTTIGNNQTRSSGANRNGEESSEVEVSVHPAAAAAAVEATGAVATSPLTAVDFNQSKEPPPPSPPLLSPPTSPDEISGGLAATTTTIPAKKRLCLGDYMFVEPACPTDAFGSAFNTKNKMIYFWKKFERRDYMKKLEPYMVMEGSSDKIYKFSEIIIQSHYASSTSLSSQHQKTPLSTASQTLVNEQSQLTPTTITTTTTGSENDDVFVLFEPHYGDLHAFMKEKKRLEEPEARLIFRQCVEAVHACHQNGIIIRDIKLKKFVFLDPQRTKIGLANLEDCLLLDEDAENDLIKSQQGCPAYVSPEVLNPIQTSYSGKLSDSWSLGIILYTLLVGRYPFHHPTIANMFARIARGKFQVPVSVQLSLDARILLRSLIRVKPDERLLPEEILAANWFRHNEAETTAAAAALANRSAASRARMMMNASNGGSNAGANVMIGSKNVSSNTTSRVHFSTSNSSSRASSSSTIAVLGRSNAAIEHNNDDDDNDDGCVPQMKTECSY